jgi:ribosomal protein L40E
MTRNSELPKRKRGWLLCGTLFGAAFVAAAGCPTTEREEPSPLRSARTGPAHNDDNDADVDRKSIQPGAQPTTLQTQEAPVLDEPREETAGAAAVDAATKPSMQTAAIEPADVTPADAVATGYNEPAEKIDPIKQNGKFFVGWPKPEVALVISGRQDGYLEPCGCAGLDNQKGGLARRHSMIEELSSQGWLLVPLDVGNSVRRFGKQAELKFATTVEAFKNMGYRAVGFGPDDLRLSAGEIAACIATEDPQDSLFVSANVNLFGLTPQVRIVEQGGLRIGITSALGDKYREQVSNSEIEISPAAEALAKVVGELADCDIQVLLANATVEESIELAKQFPQFDFVVTADGGDEPPNEAKPIPGANAKLIEVGHKGMFAVVLGFYDDPDTPVRYQRVALDSRYAPSLDMRQLMATYQEQLHDLGWQGLGLRPVAHPRTDPAVPGSGEFVGAQSCRKCHSKAWGVWSKTKHAHATESLTKATPPRQFDAECISCHATGWNPQEFFPYITGYESQERTPLLVGNQCENCHGPCGAHVAAEEGKDPRKREAQRAAVRLTKAIAEEQVCRKCHDLDNSPKFNFETYWPKVEHKGKN